MVFLSVEEIVIPSYASSVYKQQLEADIPVPAQETLATQSPVTNKDCQQIIKWTSSWVQNLLSLSF